MKRRGFPRWLKTLSFAVAILLAGDERFPEESDKFKAQIQELQAGGLDPAEIERLRSLGYL